MPKPYDPETGRAAGIKSGVARRPVDFESHAKRAYNYSIKLMDLLAGRMFDPVPCDKCKRGGPVELRTLESFVKILGPILVAVQSRGWGQPGTASPYGKTASLEDFATLRRAVERAKTDDAVTPDDLPPPPDEWDSASEDRPIEQEPDQIE